MWRRQRRGEGSTDARPEGPNHGEGLRSPEVRWKGGSSDRRRAIWGGHFFCQDSSVMSGLTWFNCLTIFLKTEFVAY